MTWQIGPIEGADYGEIKQLLEQNYERKYGPATGAHADVQRQQFEQITACMDHQLPAAAGGIEAGGYAVEITGNALTSLTTEDGGAAAPEAFVTLHIAARAPVGRFAREGMTETTGAAAAAGGPGG